LKGLLKGWGSQSVIWSADTALIPAGRVEVAGSFLSWPAFLDFPEHLARLIARSRH
jgi:hypothetical protein